jgi:hypothetical protein
MIRRIAVRPSAQKTEEHDLFDTRTLCSLDHVLRSLDVNAFVSLIVKLTIDAGTVSDSFAITE